MDVNDPQIEVDVAGLKRDELAPAEATSMSKAHRCRPSIVAEVLER
jgi:hypothetical protein